MEYTDKLKDEIKELKEENKKLKNRNMYKNLRLENEKLKKDNEKLFQAWLLYWSDGRLGEEYDCTMGEIENGKYQKLLDDLHDKK